MQFFKNKAPVLLYVDRRHKFRGKKINPPNVFPNMNCTELVDFFAQTGYNARRLAEAAEIITEMINSDATICLTIAGAMTPIGLGRTIATMIEYGFVDWIVSTGANVYHDLHFAYDLPVRQGYHDVDDDLLYKNQIVRIYDTYIKEVGTLQAQDLLIQKNMITSPTGGNSLHHSTAELTYDLGRLAKKHSSYPEKSFVVAAYEHNVPIYLPAISDSSIGLNMVPLLFENKVAIPNVIMDVAESAAILWKSKKSGGLMLGGGVPKNFFQQTGPALYQILKLKEGGQDYLVQLTDARPDTGGLSGATLQEGKSWGKIRSAHTGNTIVYGDSSVYFPFLCAYALSNSRPRRKKEIFRKKNAWLNEMRGFYRKNRKGFKKV